MLRESGVWEGMPRSEAGLLSLKIFLTKCKMLSSPTVWYLANWAKRQFIDNFRHTHVNIRPCLMKNNLRNLGKRCFKYLLVG